MIELSKIRTPAWERVVAELSAEAPTDELFLARLAAVLGQVSAARQAVLWTVPAGSSDDAEPAPARAVMVWPPAAGEAQSQVESGAEAGGAARRAVEAEHVRVFGLDGKDDPFYGGSGQKGYIIAAPPPVSAPDPLGSRPAITLLVESRSQQAMQTTLALVEVLVGYGRLHGARQQLRQSRAASAALDLAGRLIASINNAEGFKGACLQIVNDLSRQIGADRTALGWVRGIGSSGSVKLVAISDTEHLDRRMKMAQSIEAAMDECLDQEQPVLYPAPAPEDPEGDALLSGAITHAHRELAAGDVSLKIASLPLRDGDDILGVVTVESAGAGRIDGRTMELLQATLDLVAPVLRIRRSDDRPLPKRTWDSALKGAAWLVGPRHTVWKLVGLAALALALVVTFVEAPYRIQAEAELIPRQDRKVVAPQEGIIIEVPPGVFPGAAVKEGDLLARLDTYELELRVLELQEQLNQRVAEADAAQQAQKIAEADQAQLQAAQLRARIELHRKQIADAQIRAPIAGAIVAGDLRDRVGAKTDLGEALYEIAQLDDLVIVARIPDRDIAYIRDDATGQLAMRSRPDQRIDFRIETIVPLAQAEQGANVFEARAELAETPEWLRPGAEGLAKIDTGDRRLYWILKRRIEDTLRLWLWW
ncbi:MAG: efflux RND transporter periplasmic adaptor subunit [Phycisphaerales bacterium JB039]